MAARIGDEATLRDLHERYQARILAYCLRRANVNDAADAAADTFVIAWRRLAEVPSGDEALLWLYQVARRALANQRRGLKRYRQLVERLSHMPIEVSPPVEALVVRQFESDSVLSALARLSPGDREVLKLAAWEELPRALIAEMLGCSRDAVDQRFHRALRRLAGQLQDDADSRSPFCRTDAEA